MELRQWFKALLDPRVTMPFITGVDPLFCVAKETLLRRLQREWKSCFTSELQKHLVYIDATWGHRTTAFDGDNLVAFPSIYESNPWICHRRMTTELEELFVSQLLYSSLAYDEADWCLRAVEDIPRPLRSPERSQSNPQVSPVSVGPQELSPALLLPQVTMVAILGKQVDILPRRGTKRLKFLNHLHSKLVDFCRKLGAIMKSIQDPWWRRNVTSNDEAPPASLSMALAVYQHTPWTTWGHVVVEAWHWLGSLNGQLENSAELVRAATELLSICRKLAAEAAIEEANAQARARAARYGRALEHMVVLGERERARWKTRVKREARVAASRARRVRQRVEAAQRLLERLVAASKEATAFPRELHRRVEVIVDALESINGESPNVPEDLVAKVAKAEWLWEANAHLAKRHLVGAIDNITKFLLNAGRASPSVSEVAEPCQRATEGIPRLLQPPEHPQSIPEMSPLSTEPQELNLALLKHNTGDSICHNSDLADAPTSLCPATAAYENAALTTWGEKGPGDNGGQRVAQVGVHVGGQLDPADQRGHQA
ncbi:uncharacterized protein LOC132085653 isoform X1 [Ammospiza nelsoni]|uniref:uncharacterized protein LOC132085653 isoform X1 n=1 Tax=Ammospiza nelsoni TaxID=2857394 RepID=UPI00286D0AE8|nr:uncharacterized protein LOC132085653 isoform X1 [Ammospiza nelsoni]